jgi:DnaK suppressor protein
MNRLSTRSTQEAAMKGIKEELKKKRAAIEAAIHTAMDQSRGGDDRNEMTKDPYGTASMTHDDEMVADLMARRRRELANINRALEDLDAGRYGTCEDCGEAIAPKRLKALPFATRCVECQAATEMLRRAA